MSLVGYRPLPGKLFLALRVPPGPPRHQFGPPLPTASAVSEQSPSSQPTEPAPGDFFQPSPAIGPLLGALELTRFYFPSNPWSAVISPLPRPALVLLNIADPDHHRHLSMPCTTILHYATAVRARASQVCFNPSFKVNYFRSVSFYSSPLPSDDVGRIVRLYVQDLCRIRQVRHRAWAAATWLLHDERLPRLRTWIERISPYPSSRVSPG